MKPTQKRESSRITKIPDTEHQSTVPKLFDDPLLNACLKEQQAAQQERLNEWLLNFAKNNASTAYYVAASQQNNTIDLARKVASPQELSETQKNNLFSSELYAATGSSNPEFSNMVLTQTIQGCILNSNYSPESISNAMHNALMAMRPKDEFEGMLMSRNLVLHNQYMHYLNLAAQSKSQDERERHITNATKLMRVFNETLDTINKHRRKGEHKVTVTHNHVNVNNGGNAIVGSEINHKQRGES